MPFRLALKIALRHLRARRRQTLLATLGIMVGGGIFALMLAITDGQQQFLRDKLVDISPHLLVTSDRLQPITTRNLLEESAVVELRVNTPPTMRREVKPYTEILQRAENASTMVKAVAPYVLAQGVFRNGTRYQTVNVRGVDPRREHDIARLAENIQQGKLERLGVLPNGAVIGSGLARKLRVSLGDDFSFVTPSGAIQRLQVAAIFTSGIANFDDRRAYINLSLAQSLRQMSRNAVTGLSIQVRDVERVGEVKEMLQRATGYKAETWEESNVQILEFQARQRLTSRILVIFVFITAAFGISNTMVAIVLQKKQDIAIMKSFGVSRRGVVMIFMLEGAAIGILGGLLAAGLGYALASLFGSLNLFPSNNDTAYIRMDRFPVSLAPTIYLLTFGLSVVMAVVASLLPARRAATFIPVQIIRGEA